MARLQEGYWADRAARWISFDEATRRTKTSLMRSDVPAEVRSNWMALYAEERRRLFPGRDEPHALRADVVRHLVDVAERGGPDAAVAAEMVRRAMSRAQELAPSPPAKGLGA